MRYAGSAIDFTPPTLASAATRSGSASAANAVDLNETFGAMREKAPKFDALSAAAMKTEGEKQMASWNAQGDVASAGLSSLGNVTGQGISAYGQMRSAEIQAEAQKSAAQSQMFGSIAGAALGLFA